jgi:hypothetical protein
MSKFTFTCVDDAIPWAGQVTTKRTFEFEAVHIDSVIDEFQYFLKGCGFHLGGNLEIVPDEIATEDEDNDGIEEYATPTHSQYYYDYDRNK